MKKVILIASLICFSSLSFAVSEAELVRAIAKDTALTQKQVDNVIEAFKSEVISQTRAGNEVRLSGLGKFISHHREARDGRNPRTGEKIRIPARNYLKFKTFDSANKQLN